MNKKTYLMVNENGTECICKPITDNIPQRFISAGQWFILGDSMSQIIEIPKGSIQKLIGKELTWNDEPYSFE